MYTRELAKQAWREAGLYDSKKAKIQAFLKYFEDNPDHCWDECTTQFRETYGAVFRDLVIPLFDTGDPLIRINIIQRMNVRSRRELNLLKSFVQEADPEHDEIALVAVAKLGHRGLATELRKRSNLTGKVQRMIAG